MLEREILRIPLFKHFSEIKNIGAIIAVIIVVLRGNPV